MKKAVIIGPAYPLRGGLATFNHRFAEELTLNHIHPVIYTFNLQYPSFLFPGKSQLDTDQTDHGLDIRPRINSLNPFNWVKVAREIAGLKPDLIICHYWIPFFGPSLGTILRLIKKKCKTKIVALVDNLIPHEKRLGDKLLTRYFMEPIEYFLVMSDKVKKDIDVLGLNKPIIKLTHPVYDNYGTGVPRSEGLRFLGLPSDSTYLLFFGFVRKYKGLDLLIQAMADPLLRQAKIKLIVAGDFYEKENKYRELIERHAISEKVIVHPSYVPDKDVKYYFGACDLVVLPYRTASQSGISQIALHFAKPVLITDVGGLPEIVDDGINGFIARPEPDQIAAGIVRFLEEKNKSVIHGNILKCHDQFSWSDFTRSFLRQLEFSLPPRMKKIQPASLTQNMHY